MASDSNQANVETKKSEKDEQQFDLDVAAAATKDAPAQPKDEVETIDDDDEEEEVEVLMVAASTEEDTDDDEDEVIEIKPPVPQEESARQKRGHHEISRAQEEYKVSVGDLFGFPKEVRDLWREVKEEVRKGPTIKTNEEATDWSYHILVKARTCTRDITTYITWHFDRERQVRDLLLTHARARFNVIKAYTDIIVYSRLGDDWNQQQRLAIDCRKGFTSDQFQAKTQLLSFMQY